MSLTDRVGPVQKKKRELQDSVFTLLYFRLFPDTIGILETNTTNPYFFPNTLYSNEYNYYSITRNTVLLYHHPKLCCTITTNTFFACLHQYIGTAQSTLAAGSKHCFL